MTLNTAIVVKDPVPAFGLFRYCQSLLGDPDRQSWNHVVGQGWGGGSEYENRPGQGLAALLSVTYDVPPGRYNDPHYCGEVTVRFDTAYHFTGRGGAHCGDLHAWLVSRVALWLEARGARYHWVQESTGERFESADPGSLAALGSPKLGALSCPPAPAVV